MKLKIRLIFIIIAVFFIDITVYAYTEYKVGDVVSYNGMEFYVIKDSGSKDDSVTMLKVEPLTAEDIATYSAGTGAQTNGDGGMQYGTTSDYSTSYVKKTVDAWKVVQAPLATEARLITYQELVDYLGYNNGIPEASWINVNPEYTPNWVYNSNYWYWSLSPYEDSENSVWDVQSNGRLHCYVVGYYGLVVRPVIILKKTTLRDEEENIKDDNKDEVLPDSKNNVDKKETTTKVKVENTYMSQTLIVMIIGFISICSGVVIYYLIKNKKINNK